MRWDNYCSKLSRSRDSDNQEEIYERARASADELPPLSIFRLQMEERGQASNDENEVPDATECHHHGFGPPHLTAFVENDWSRLPHLPDESRRGLVAIRRSARPNRAE